jgi:hypothetical protein
VKAARDNGSNSQSGGCPILIETLDVPPACVGAGTLAEPLNTAETRNDNSVSGRTKPDNSAGDVTSPPLRGNSSLLPKIRHNGHGGREIHEWRRKNQHGIHQRVKVTCLLLWFPRDFRSHSAIRRGFCVERRILQYTRCLLAQHDWMVASG